MIDEFMLAELLNAKYSHDLAGPIGAVSNSIEFLYDENDAIKAKARTLIETSSQQSVSRLKFFRQVYGSTPLTGDADLSNLKQLILKYYEQTKVKIDWDLSDLMSSNNSLSYRFAKLLLNLITIISSSLIKGGEVKIITIVKGDNVILEINANGEEVVFDKDNQDILEGKIDYQNLSSRNIQFYYSNRLICQLKAKLKLSVNKTHFELRIEAKN